VFRVEDGRFVIDEGAGTDEEIEATVAQCPADALKIEKR
jgi:ferredoxin